MSIPMVSLAQLPTSQSVGLPASQSVGTAGNTTSGNYTLQNPLNFSTVCGLVKAIFNVVLTLGVPVAVLFLVYAGFKFIIARGNPEELRKARANLTHVLMGIAIFLGAWILGQVIANTVNSLAAAAGQPSVTGNACN